MTRYLIRHNCEYTQEVEAETPEEAIKIAGFPDTDGWTQAWAPAEVEED